jgi:hypothetical protein
VSYTLLSPRAETATPYRIFDQQIRAKRSNEPKRSKECPSAQKPDGRYLMRAIRPENKLEIQENFTNNLQAQADA